MKILGLLYFLTDPASRARILQYKDEFEKNKISLTCRHFYPEPYADPAPWAIQLNKFTRISEWRYLWMHKMIKRFPLFINQYKYDLIWQNRLIIPYHSFFEKNLSKPIVFDFDDAIWLHAGTKQVNTAIKKATVVFAGNEYLADYANKYNKKVEIVPSTIDTKLLFPLNKKPDNFTIGWIGSFTNFKFLELIKPAIEEFLAANKTARFIIVSSEEPKNITFDNKQIFFKYWSSENENNLINEFSIGLMPLTDDPFTQGKCSYKMLQYMACGIPVVVSPVGMNNKILKEKTVGLAANTTKEWLSAFETLKNDSNFYTTCSLNGRSLVESDYSLSKYTPLIISHFKNAIN